MTHTLPTSVSLYVVSTYTSAFGLLLLLLIASFFLFWATLRTKRNRNQLNDKSMMAIHLSSTIRLCIMGMTCLAVGIVQTSIYIWYCWMYGTDRYLMVYWSASIALVILDYIYQVALTCFVLQLAFEAVRKACKVSIVNYRGIWFGILVSGLIFFLVFGVGFGYVVTPIVYVAHLFCNFIGPEIVESAQWSTNLTHLFIVGVSTCMILFFSVQLSDPSKFFVDHLDVDFSETERQAVTKAVQTGRLMKLLSVIIFVYLFIFLLQNAFLEIPQIYLREISALGSNAVSENLHLWLSIIPQFYTPVMFIVFALCLGKFNSVKDPEVYIQ